MLQRPNLLYRFTSIDRLKDIWQKQLIYLPKLSQLNDPFEDNPSLDFSFDLSKINCIVDYFFPTNEERKREEFMKWWNNENENGKNKILFDLFADYVIDYIQQLRRKTRVLSFSQNFHNELMWAHYANSHKGICIGFDLTVLAEKDKLMFQKVKYLDELPKVKTYDYYTDFPNFLISYIQTVATKKRDWCYEEEWRIVHTNDLNCSEDDEFKSLNFSTTKGFLKCVIFGLHTTDEEKYSVLKNLVKYNISFFECTFKKEFDRRIYFNELSLNDNDQVEIKQIEIASLY